MKLRRFGSDHREAADEHFHQALKVVEGMHRLQKPCDPQIWQPSLGDPKTGEPIPGGWRQRGTQNQQQWASQNREGVVLGAEGVGVRQRRVKVNPNLTRSVDQIPRKNSAVRGEFALRPGWRGVTRPSRPPAVPSSKTTRGEPVRTQK